MGGKAGYSFRRRWRLDWDDPKSKVPKSADLAAYCQYTKIYTEFMPKPFAWTGPAPQLCGRGRPLRIVRPRLPEPHAVVHRGGRAWARCQSLSPLSRSFERPQTLRNLSMHAIATAYFGMPWLSLLSLRVSVVSAATNASRGQPDGCNWRSRARALTRVETLARVSQEQVCQSEVIEGQVHCRLLSGRACRSTVGTLRADVRCDVRQAKPSVGKE